MHIIQKVESALAITWEVELLRTNVLFTTICLPWTNNIFCILIFHVSNGMSLKGMIESSLLSKDAPLTPNIDKVPYRGLNF